MLDVPELDFGSQSWIGHSHWYLIHQCSKFVPSLLVLKVQQTSMSFKSWFGVLENAEDSWLRFGILILIWICSLVSDIPLFWILALLSWFWRWHPCPLSPYFRFSWMLEDPDWVLGSWSWFGYGHWSYINLVPNFGSLSWFWRRKDHSCPSSPDLGLWRMLEVTDWGLWSWYWFVTCLMVFDTPIFQILALYLGLGGAKNIHVL